MYSFCHDMVFKIGNGQHSYVDNLDLLKMTEFFLLFLGNPIKHVTFSITLGLFVIIAFLYSIKIKAHINNPVYFLFLILCDSSRSISDHIKNSLRFRICVRTQVHTLFITLHNITHINHQPSYTPYKNTLPVFLGHHCILNFLIIELMVYK